MASLVLAVIGVRLLAKIAGVAIANPGSGASWKQAFWVGCAMSPLSSIALLIASNFATASPLLGAMITQMALPSILLMEVVGAMLATVAIRAWAKASSPGCPEVFRAPTRRRNDEHRTQPQQPPIARQRRPAGATLRTRSRARAPFNKSEALSLGVELELQMVNTNDYDLAPYAEDMLRLMSADPAARQRGARDDVEHDRDLDQHLPLGAGRDGRS